MYGVTFITKFTSKFKNYKGLSLVLFKIFDGNTDQNTVVNNKLKNPIITRYIRIIPLDYHNMVSLRAEFYGCRSGKYSRRWLPKQDLCLPLYDPSERLPS